MKKFNPSSTYEGLLKQARALYTMVTSKEQQLSVISRQNVDIKKQLSANNHNALRDTIEKLTNLLEPTKMNLLVETVEWATIMGYKIERTDFENGDIFIMEAGFQQTHEHRIPKCDRPCGPRLSLTFRKYKQT